jgi:hypothetical protein
MSRAAFAVGWVVAIGGGACGFESKPSCAGPACETHEPDTTADAGPDTPAPDMGGPMAGLRFTEINPAGQHDIVELVTVTPGDLEGLRIVEHTNSHIEFAFPPGFTVRHGDVVVIHFSGSCSDQPGNAEACGTAAPFSGAWDFSVPGQLTYSGKVFELLAGDGASIDAVPFIESSGMPPSSYVAAVQLIQSHGVWNPMPCKDGPSNGPAQDRYCRNISVIWDDLKDDNTNSVQRIVGHSALAVPGAGPQWTPALPSTFGEHTMPGNS